MRRAVRRLVGVLAVVCATAAPAQDADRTETPADLQAFLAGDDAALASAWLRTVVGGWDLVPELRRRGIEAGRGSWRLWWRRTGSPDGPWREDRSGLRAPLPGRWGSWEAELGLAGPRGEAWPAGGRLAWRPTLGLGAGWRLTLRWDLLEVRRPWLSRSHDRIRLHRNVLPWALWGAWGLDRDGRPGLELGVRRRVHVTAALEGGRTAGGVVYGALLVRRGPLVVRVRQGVHPLLGIWRAWEVGLCGAGF